MKPHIELAKMLSEAAGVLREGPVDTFIYGQGEVLAYAEKLERLAEEIQAARGPIRKLIVLIKRKIMKLDFLPTGKWDDMTTGERSVEIANTLDRLL